MPCLRIHQPRRANVVILLHYRLSSASAPGTRAPTREKERGREKEKLLKDFISKHVAVFEAFLHIKRARIYRDISFRVSARVNDKYRHVENKILSPSVLGPSKALSIFLLPVCFGLRESETRARKISETRNPIIVSQGR